MMNDTNPNFMHYFENLWEIRQNVYNIHTFANLMTEHLRVEILVKFR